MKTYWAVAMNERLPSSFTWLHAVALFSILSLGENLLKNRLIDEAKCVFSLDAKDGTGMTALHWTASEGHVVRLRLLLAKGVIIRIKCRHGRNALHLTVRNGHEIVIQLLLNQGANTRLRTGEKLQRRISRFCMNTKQQCDCC